MAIVKHPHEASAVTLESKHQRYDRLRRLFGIRRLGDLFPPGSTPNGAAHDPAYCSGDVLRDLCQIGEYLKNKGVGRSERCERVRKVCGIFLFSFCFCWGEFWFSFPGRGGIGGSVVGGEID